MRKRRTPQAREAICVAHDWVCVICSGKIDPVREKWILEHLLALAAGGTDTEDNMGPAHQKCAVEKTKSDLGIIAKINRVRSKHLGTKIKSGRPLPGTKRSRWKHKVNGEWVRRSCPTFGRSWPCSA